MPMLSKAATSFRPFLRLQSHQPDLFTSNPSLLHHFQQHGLVAQGAAQTATGSGGAAGGAGRAYSGASSGGYTGHARAFLSLPGSGADISGVNTSAEEREKTKARQRAGLALKQRGTKAASPEPSSLPRTVMMQERMAQRAGSRPVAMVEMRDDGDLAELEGSQRRGSIAYPSWAALPSDPTPGGALWLPGSAPRPMGARAFSTAVRHTADEEIPVPFITATPGPDSQVIDQPNRVLQDLAGLDLGKPGRMGQKRRNSTASVVRSDIEAAKETGDKTPDLQIYQAINKARSHDPAAALAIIEHYRTPRSASNPATGNPELAERLPLGPGYSTPNYNLCLEVVLDQRQRGDSIAPILDMYNEMLARDVVPNMRTTALVIRALCLREEDVSAASRRWEELSEYHRFTRENLGVALADDLVRTPGADEAIEAYQTEENLASALNLYRVASSFYPAKSQTERAVLIDLLNAASTSIGLAHAPAPDKIRPLIELYMSSHVLDPEGMPAVLELLAAYGDKVAVVDAWERLLADDQELRSEWRNARTRELKLSAIRALCAVGVTEKAAAIVDGAKVPGGEYLHRVLWNGLIRGLAKTGDVEAAVQRMEEEKGMIWTDAAMDVAEVLIAVGRCAEGARIVADARRISQQEQPGKFMDLRRCRRLYQKTMEQAIKSSEHLDALALMANNCFPSGEAYLIGKHIELLLNAGRYADVPQLLFGHPARKAVGDAVRPETQSLREAMANVVTSDAPISIVLDSIRAFVRYGQPLTHPMDSIPIPTVIVDKYLASRARVESATELGINLDGWYRLLDIFGTIPSAHIDAGAADAALETYFADIAAVQEAGVKFPNTALASQSMVDLTEILEARFGAEKTDELLIKAFTGPRVAHLLRSATPEQSLAGSESEFTLPATPESAQSPTASVQAAAENTLHISPKLGALIDRLAAPAPALTPVQTYNMVKENISAHNAAPAPDAIGKLITALARIGDEAKARELYSLAQVVLGQCVPDPQSQAEGWHAVEDAMIAACCFLGQLEQAGMHRARIIEAGMAPSADAYATMIASSRDSTDDALVARELFDESQRLGVVPHLYLFNTIISKLSKARKAEMALDLFQHMKTAGIRPSSVTYGAVINACCRVGDAESAENLFEEMRLAPNFKPRVPPFNTMMQFHLQTRPSRQRVLYYYNAMRSSGVRPSAHTYKLLLDAYGTLAPVDLTSMNRVFAELSADRKIPVQGTHWASLITAFGLHEGNVDRALSVFDSIPSHPSTQTTVPEPVVWEAILNVLGQKGSLEQLEAMRARLDASGSRPTAYVCNVLIAGYAKHGKIDVARSIFEGMADSVTGVAAPNNHPALLTSSGHVKPSTTTPQPTDVVYREPSTYEVMVRAELQAGERARAEAVLGRMEDRRYPVAVWMKARAILDEQV